MSDLYNKHTKINKRQGVLESIKIYIVYRLIYLNQGQIKITKRGGEGDLHPRKQYTPTFNFHSTAAGGILTWYIK